MPSRAEDRSPLGAWYGRWGRDVVVAVAVGVAAWSVLGLRSETARRVNESCTITETKQRGDVEALERTYKYLASLSAKELAEPLNRTILAGLPRTIREAQTDDAPAYCDDPGVGLPEPDPVLPKRPASLPPA